MSENLKKDNAEIVEAPVVEETKVEVAIEEKVVEPEIKEVPSIAYTENGAIGSGTNKGNKPKADPKVQPVKSNKVAVFSTASLYASEAGKVAVGYNILNKKDAEWWLAKRPSTIRLATPQEVAEAFAE